MTFNSMDELSKRLDKIIPLLVEIQRNNNLYKNQSLEQDKSTNEKVEFSLLLEREIQSTNDLLMNSIQRI